MSCTYDQRKRPQGPKNIEPERTAAPGPSMEALMTGTARPTAAQKGRPIDLDAAMKAKMEHAFGDLSAVKLYESQAVGDVGAEAIAQGNEIAFAPGMADFSTRSGQERLGHELSHVMSQRSGAVRGEGFLASAFLEARADREGAMAAAGEQVYTGPVTNALSNASPSPSIAGPMQASRRDADAKEVKEMQNEGEDFNGMYATPGYSGYNTLDPNEWETKTHQPGFSKLWGKKSQTYKVRRGGLTTVGSKIDRKKDLSNTLAQEEGDTNSFRPGMKKLFAKLDQKYSNKEKSKDFAYSRDWSSNASRPANPIIEGVNDKDPQDKRVSITGLGIARIFQDLATDRGRGFDMSAEEMEQFFDDLMAPKKNGLSEREQLDANKRFDNAMLTYKKILSDDMNYTEKTYGRLMSQLHPADVAAQMGTGKEFERYFRFQQDADQLVHQGGERYFDLENNEADKHFEEQINYYSKVYQRQLMYNPQANGPDLDDYAEYASEAEGLEDKIGGPQMSQKLFKRYVRGVQNRARSKKDMRVKLFGRYLPDREV